MELGATKEVQDRLKTTKIEESKGASLVFCWDTHLTKIKGRNVLFIVNASNRYTIAMTDIEPRNWNYYTMYIRSVIHGVMQEMGYSEEQIGQYFKMSGDTTVTKTHGRKSVGGINRMVMDAQYFGKKLEKEAKYQWKFSEYLNRDICQPQGFDAYGYPSELFKLDMERLGIAAKRKPATHLDFLIYNRIGKKPVLAIEVDGYEYHKEDTVQASRDLLKNHIMELYEVPLLRFMTNGSGEKEKIIEMLDKLVG